MTLPFQPSTTANSTLQVQYIFTLKNVKEKIAWGACNHQVIERK
jgi:hypothetical protein